MLQQIQNESREWRERNFAHSRFSGDQLLGCLEELGELSHHILKDKQQIRGTHKEHLEGIKDSLGDTVIYLMGYCDGAEASLLECVNLVGYYPGVEFKTEVQLALHAGYELGRLIGYGGQYRGLHSRQIGRFYHTLDAIAREYFPDTNLAYITYDVWLHVRQRDWLKNTIDGSME